MYVMHYGLPVVPGAYLKTCTLRYALRATQGADQRVIRIGSISVECLPGLQCLITGLLQICAAKPSGV